MAGRSKKTSKRSKNITQRRAKVPTKRAPKHKEDLTGGSTIEIVDKLYGANAEGASPPTGTVLHWYGQFSDELPAPFRLPDGGHGWLQAKDLAQAKALFEKLRAFVLALPVPPDPDLGLAATKEWAGDGWYRWMLADGRQTTVEFKIASRLTPAQKRLVRTVR